MIASVFYIVLSLFLTKGKKLFISSVSRLFTPSKGTEYAFLTAVRGSSTLSSANEPEYSFFTFRDTVFWVSVLQFWGRHSSSLEVPTYPVPD